MWHLMGGGNHIIDYAFNDIHPNGGDGSVNPDFWLGNVKKWNKIMRKMKLPFGTNDGKSL